MPLFRKKKTAPSDEHALRTHLPLSDYEFGTEDERGFPVRPGAYAIKRYGRADDPDAREERVELS